MAESRAFNLRVPDWLDELVEEAASLAGQNKSAFGRDALEAGARREVEAHLARLRRLGPSELGGGFVTVPGRCVHPPGARRTTPTVEFCSLCSTVTRWLL